jgi:hypothetical protein
VHVDRAQTSLPLALKHMQNPEVHHARVAELPDERLPENTDGQQVLATDAARTAETGVFGFETFVVQKTSL